MFYEISGIQNSNASNVLEHFAPYSEELDFQRSNVRSEESHTILGSFCSRHPPNNDTNHSDL